MNKLLSIGLVIALLFSSLIIISDNVSAMTYYVNEDMEDGTANGLTYLTGAGSSTVVTDRSHSGEKSLKISGNGAYITMGYPSIAHTTYSIECWLNVGYNNGDMGFFQPLSDSRARTSGPYMTISSDGTGASTSYIRQWNFTSSSYERLSDNFNINTWVKVKVNVIGSTFNVQVNDGAIYTKYIQYTENTQSYYGLGANDAGNFYIDDIKIVDAFESPQWKPSFTSTPSTEINTNEEYSYQITTNETCALTADSIPAWSTLDGSQITGTPTTAGDHAFSIKATSTAGSLSEWQNWTLTVSDSILWSPTFNNVPSTVNLFGEIYDFNASCNETVTYSYQLPIWAGFVDDHVTGLADEVGTYEFILNATSINGGGTTQLKWNVTVSEDMRIQIIQTPSLSATNGVYYTTFIRALNESSYSMDTNADWLLINESTGQIYGIAQTGEWYVNVTIIDSGTLDTEYYNYTLNVSGAVPIDPDVIPPIDDNDIRFDNGSLILICGIVIIAIGGIALWKLGKIGILIMIIGILIVVVRIGGII